MWKMENFSNNLFCVSFVHAKFFFCVCLPIFSLHSITSLFISSCFALFILPPPPPHLTTTILCMCVMLMAGARSIASCKQKITETSKWIESAYRVEDITALNGTCNYFLSIQLSNEKLWFFSITLPFSYIFNVVFSFLLAFLFDFFLASLFLLPCLIVFLLAHIHFQLVVSYFAKKFIYCLCVWVSWVQEGSGFSRNLLEIKVQDSTFLHSGCDIKTFSWLCLV